MNDQEIVEIIATKVMGWEQKPVRNMGLVWHDEDGRMRAFAPLSSDDCCMKAWDKFSDMDRFSMALIERQSDKTWSAEIWLDDEVAT